MRPRQQQKFVEVKNIQDDALRDRMIAKVDAREDAWWSRTISRPRAPISAWCGHAENAFRVDKNGVDVCTACAPVPEDQLKPEERIP